MALSVK